MFVTIDYLRIATGWSLIAILALIPITIPHLVLLSVIIAAILFCSFGVVKQAERLAKILGDPYGSLILTLSIVIIEVILISAVMLGSPENVTIARDSVMAVSMIILALVVGLGLILAGIRHGSPEHNGIGTQTYLSLILLMAAVAFALPHFVGGSGSYHSTQAIVIAILIFSLYVFFLWRQTGAQAAEFRETDVVPTIAASSRSEVGLRIIVLIATVLPIVWLSHDMAATMTAVLENARAPIAVAGLIIAVIVFLPETLTALRASWNGEVQRLSNLAHGALVSTVGLTIPAVLIIGELNNQQVVLAESPINLLLLGLALGVSLLAFSARKISAVHGAALLVIFGLYVMSLFS